MQTNAGESIIPDAQITIPMELMLSRLNDSEYMCALVYVCMYVCVHVLLLLLYPYAVGFFTVLFCIMLSCLAFQ